MVDKSFGRRQIIAGALVAVPSLAALAQRTSFDDLFKEALRKPGMLANSRLEREGLADDYDRSTERAALPRRVPSPRPISERSKQLIVLFEVSSRSRYEKQYRHPTWPGGESGLTVGIGYDLGYVERQWLKEDWYEILDASELAELEPACAVKGQDAAKLVRRLQGFDLSWEKATKQFNSVSLPRFIAETVASLPNTKDLSADSLGALVSLVYNRGATFMATGARYKEMRAIRRHLE